MKQISLKISKKIAAVLSCLSIFMMACLYTVTPVMAGTSGPVSGYSTNPYSNLSAGSSLAIEQSQHVDIYINLNTTITDSYVH